MTEDELYGLRVGVDLSKLRSIDLRQLGLRFVFGAVISVAAALIGLRFGHRAGGLFLAFPAILPATLTLIENEEGKRAAQTDAVGAVLGAIALACFAAVAVYLLPRAPLAVTLLAASAAWVAAATSLYYCVSYLLVVRRQRREAPDRPGVLPTGRTL